MKSEFQGAQGDYGSGEEDGGAARTQQKQYVRQRLTKWVFLT